MDHWERSTGMLRPGTPSDGGQDVSEEIHVHPPSGRKTKKGSILLSNNIYSVTPDT